MGRFFYVRVVLVAALLSLALSGVVWAQSPESSGTVNLTFSVPAHIELIVKDETVSISSWEFSGDGRVEGESFGASMIGSAEVSQHLTVHSNVPAWSLSQAFDTNAFLSAGGHVVIKLTHSLGAPSVVFSSTSDSNSYAVETGGSGTSTFDVVYYVVAPFSSDVNPQNSYNVQVTYTITAL